MRKVLFILGVLTDEDIEWLLRMGNKLHLKAGEVLIQEAAFVSALYIVLEGQLGVYVHGTQKVADLKAGEMVGEISFVDKSPTTAAVKAERETTVFAIDDNVLRQHLADDNEFAARFYRALAAFLAYRLRDTTTQLGYGRETRLDHEMDDPALEDAYVAGVRFEHVLRELMG